MSALRIQALQSHLLKPVELRIDAGELVFLSGPSGSGKSLLLRAIADLDPNTGEAYCGDAARSSLPARTWRRRVGLLPAESGWWEELVGAHFPVAGPSDKPRGRGDAGATDARAADLPQADLASLLARLGFAPDVLGWTVARLSTGERQRLALARLLANRPEVLLLDEATANLDPGSRTRVEGVVADYRVDQAAAVLWVSHDPEQRRRMNGRRLVIAGGRLLPEIGAAQGGHADGVRA